MKPVPDEIVEKTLPYLPSPVAAMVRLQRLTGMRPGEVRSMRLCDINTSDTEWLYIPYEHKTEHHDDCPRLVILGERSQSILTPYLMDCQDTPEKWLFSPRESVAERKRELREKRKTKVQPSQITTKLFYWDGNPAPAKLACTKKPVPMYCPSQKNLGNFFETGNSQATRELKTEIKSMGKVGQEQDLPSG